MRDARLAFRWFWAWNEDRETSWLESMAREGWHLEAYGFGIYRFRRGEPRDAVYRLDFNPDAWKNRDEYLGIYRDAGWEPVLRFGSWYYFRCVRGTAASDEIHTDRGSKAGKYRKLLGVLALAVVLNIGAPLRLGRDANTALLVLSCFRLAMLALCLYGMARIGALIRRLRR